MLPNREHPVQAAEAFSTAAHDLALASRRFEEPGDSYQVLGDLQTSLIALQQTLRQVAAFHERERHRAATDAGDRAVGEGLAEAAAHHLDNAAGAVDRATDDLMAGFAKSGRIAWEPDPVTAVLTDRGTGLEITDTPTATPGSSPPSPAR